MFREAASSQPEDYIFMQFAPIGECSYCDEQRQQNSKHFPPHTARWQCGSGRYNHCTCDRCW
jgi:hypothetical protein